MFPNSVECWGPTGMVFFRNVQFRWIPVQDSTHSLWVAAERPGASGDQGIYVDRVELDGIERVSVTRSLGRLQVQRRMGIRQSGGHVAPHQLGRHQRLGLLRLQRPRHRVGINLKLEPQADRQGRRPPAVRVWRRHPELHERLAGGHRRSESSGHYATGATEPPIEVRRWESSGSSPSSITSGVPIAPPLVTPCRTSTTRRRRQTHSRPATTRSATSWSIQCPTSCWAPRIQWGRRVNFSDGFESDGYKLQFSFKYNFSWKLGG